MVTDN